MEDKGCLHPDRRAWQTADRLQVNEAVGADAKNANQQHRDHGGLPETQRSTVDKREQQELNFRAKRVNAPRTRTLSQEC